jgi:hypothetical protein
VHVDDRKSVKVKSDFFNFFAESQKKLSAKNFFAQSQAACSFFAKSFFSLGEEILYREY